MFIYLIVNRVTGKYYVGQHKGKDLKRYFQKKFSSARHVRGSSHLFNSMRKHPLPCDWSIHALLSDVQTRAELDAYERDFIAFLKSRDPEYGYNICRGGEGFTGPHTEESRRKSSLNNARYWKGKKRPVETYTKIIATRREKYGTGTPPGWNQNPELIAKRVASRRTKGNYGVYIPSYLGKHHTEEAKQKIREKRLGQAASPESRHKMSESHKRLKKKLSEAQRRHLSEINIGENNPNFGTKNTEETKEKKRRSMLARGIKWPSQSELREMTSQTTKRETANRLGVSVRSVYLHLKGRV